MDYRWDGFQRLRRDSWSWMGVWNKRYLWTRASAHVASDLTAVSCVSKSLSSISRRASAPFTALWFASVHAARNLASSDTICLGRRGQLIDWQLCIMKVHKYPSFRHEASSWMIIYLTFSWMILSSSALATSISAIIEVVLTSTAPHRHESKVVIIPFRKRRLLSIW